MTKERISHQVEAEFLDLARLSIFSSIAVITLRGYLRVGMLHYRLRGKILVRKSEFIDWVKQHRVEPFIPRAGDVVDNILSKVM